MNQEVPGAEQDQVLLEKLRGEAGSWLKASCLLLPIAMGFLGTWLATDKEILKVLMLVAGGGIVYTGATGFYLRSRTKAVEMRPAVPSKPKGPAQFSLDNLVHGLPWPKGRTVVLVTGYWDILHAGHVEFLRASKESDEEVLVVGVHSDDLARQIKGSGRPVMGVADRMVALLGLKAVDYVFEATSFYDDPPYRMLRSIKPDVVVFSREPGRYAKKTELIEFIKQYAKNGGKPQIRVVPIQRPDLHTESIIARIRAGGETVLREDKTRWIRHIHYTLRGIAEDGCKDGPTAAIFSQGGQVIGHGCNIRPTYSADEEVVHLDSDTEEFRKGEPRPVHAEIVALLDALQSKEPVDFSQCEVYCLTAPCAACAEILARLNIAGVYYFMEFTNNFGILVLKEHGIHSEKIDLE